MKLLIKVIGTDERATVLLCDEQGQPLPNQIETTLHCSHAKREIAVRFSIFGDDISFAPSKSIDPST